MVGRWRDIVASYNFTSLLSLISFFKKEPISFFNPRMGPSLRFHLTVQLFLSLGIACIERIASVFLRKNVQYMTRLTPPQGKDEAESQSQFIQLLARQKTLLFKWQAAIQCIRMITMPRLLQSDVADVELVIDGIRRKTVTPFSPALMKIWEYMDSDAILNAYVKWLDKYRERRVASCTWNRREIEWKNQTMMLHVQFSSSVDVAITHQGALCDYCTCNERW